MAARHALLPANRFLLAAASPRVLLRQTLRCTPSYHAITGAGAGTTLFWTVTSCRQTPASALSGRRGERHSTGLALMTHTHRCKATLDLSISRLSAG